MDAKALGRRQPARSFTSIAGLTVMLSALSAPMQPASANVSSGIFRCAGIHSQEVSYQQMPCDGASGDPFDSPDLRTDAQQHQARQVARREQDTAVAMSYTRQVEERHALAETGRARALTVIKKPRATTNAPAPTTLIPKKRDFRASSPKVAKARTAKNKPQKRALSAAQS